MNQATRNAKSVEEVAESPSSEMLYRREDPSGYFVSEHSKWEDEVWRYSREISINWKIELPDNTLLTDIGNAKLLNMWRRFCESTLSDCRSGQLLSIGSVPNLSTAVHRIAPWMVLRHHSDFSTLDRLAFEEFVDDWIAEFMVGRFDNEEDYFDENLTEDDSIDGFQPLYTLVTIWARLWGQTPALEEIGIPGLPEDPLDGKSSLKYTKQLFDLIHRSIPQLPDEVALPTMNEAHKWVEQRADDIIRLTEHCMKFLTKTRGSQISRTQMLRFGTFCFSKDFQTGEPWHEPITPSVTIVRGRRERKAYAVPTLQVRELISDLFGACTIVIQSESGMRPGELRALPASQKYKNDKHDAILQQRSISGLTELFFLNSLLLKGQPAPVPGQWLAGARPIGSTFLPGPIKAVWVLQRLLNSWRRIASSDVKHWLLVGQASGTGLPLKGTAITHASTGVVLSSQRNFISRNVDLSSLPDRSELGEDLTRYRETKGQCLLTYQWRKSYAMYVIRTDRRMVPAIATQFKHMSVAITENAYLSNNPDLLRERDAQQSRAAASFMYRRVVGKEPSPGRIAKLVDQYADSIREIVGDANRPDGIEQLQGWCERRGIRVFCSPHGKCFIRIAPMEARCHKVAGTLHWSVKQPNFQTREPDLCAGCACFGVDVENAEFWIDRYIECETAWQYAKKTKLVAGFRIIQQRAEIAENMLHLLGIDLPPLPHSTVKGE